MAAIYKVASGVPCRACGAVLAPAGSNEFGLCENCWTEARLHAGVTYDMRRTSPATGVLTEDQVTAWLAHKLVKDLKRLRANGVVGRCEAVSGWVYGHQGTQCAKVATGRRDGRLVCGLHRNASQPRFVGEDPADGYEMLKVIIADLANADDRFAAIIREVSK